MQKAFDEVPYHKFLNKINLDKRIKSLGDCNWLKISKQKAGKNQQFLHWRQVSSKVSKISIDTCAT